jgi:hypothetical protein
MKWMEVMGMCMCYETAVIGNVIVHVMRLVMGMLAYCHESDSVGSLCFVMRNTVVTGMCWRCVSPLTCLCATVIM